MNKLSIEYADMKEHVIAQCRWHSTFDDNEGAYQLQEYFSHFSHTYLSDILESEFEHFCPSGQVWRIDQLTLDLGAIEYSELSRQLPLRIKASLIEQLLLFKQRSAGDEKLALLDASQCFGQNSELLTNEHSYNNFIDHFLRRGSSPWWFSGDQSSFEIFQQQVNNDVEGITQVIRDVGQSLTTRQRIVWQWGTVGVKKVITILEPFNHKSIFEFANNLRQWQKETQHPKASVEAFERHSWMWILKHLLIERGSLFNTSAFVKSTLLQMSNQFDLDYDELLQYLVSSIQLLRSKGLATPVFCQAIEVVHRQAKQKVKTIENEVTINYWQLMPQCLYQGSVKGPSNNIKLAELFDFLVTEDQERMLVLLKKHGRDIRVRQQLIRHLADPEMARLIELLAPENHRFIFSHGHHTCKAIQQQSSIELVWQTILGYLLADGGSHFNRLMFVRQTLLTLCRVKGLDYFQLLSQLHNSSLEQGGYYQRFELLDIFNQLQREQLIKRPANNWVMVKHFLRHGSTKAVNDWPKLQHVFTSLVMQETTQIVILVQKEAQFVDKWLLSKRLYELTQGNQYSLLFCALDSKAGAFCLKLLSQLNGVAIFNGVDCQRLLPQLMIFCLLENLGKTFSVDRFFINFSTLLAAKFGVNATQYLQQLDEGKYSKLSCWEQPSTLSKPFFDLHLGNIQEFIQLSFEKKSAILLACLRGDLIVDYSLNAMFSSFSEKHYQRLLKFINKQSDRNALLSKLLKQSNAPEIQQWLLFISPVTQLQQRKLIDCFSITMSHHGMWQGSSLLLREKLTTTLWLCVFNQLFTGKTGMHNLLVTFIEATCAQFHLTQTNCFTYIQQQGGLETELPKLKGMVEQLTRNEENLTPNSEPCELVADQSGHYLNHTLFNSLLSQLLRFGRLPVWLALSSKISLHNMVNDLLKWQPYRLPTLLKNLHCEPKVMSRLTALIDWSVLVSTLKKSINQGVLLNQLDGFYQGLKHVELAPISTQQLQQELLQILLQAWFSGNWSCLTAHNIVVHFSTRLINQYYLAGNTIYKALLSQQQYFPNTVNFDITIDSLPPQRINNPIIIKDASQQQAMPIMVSNAGIVILQSFITTYFERLGIVKNNQFVNPQAQLDAVHYLQHLVTGFSETEEQHLLFNKLLCGLAIDQPIASGIYISDDEKATAEGLIDAMIDYWSAIGGCSIDGFRGNWLIREGHLSEQDDRWSLVVDKKPYDLLMQRAPFSYVIVKLPWMAKPVYVDWQM